MIKIKNFKSVSNPSTILRYLVGTTILVMSFGTLFSSYFQQNYSETISFYVRDGWCKTGLQGIGAHCFGDFYAPISVASDSNPWENSLHLAYTPLSLLYFRLMGSAIFNQVNTHFTVILNILLTIGALMLPGLYIWKNQKDFKKISAKWVILLSLTSGPALIMIDRGSSSFLLFPTVFFFYLGIQRQQFPMTLISLLIMGLWKPQSLILATGILMYFGLRKFTKFVVVYLVLFSGSFLLYPHEISKNVSDWLQNSKNYQNYVPIPTPGNYSFVNFLGFLNGGLNILRHGLTNLDSAFRPPVSADFVSVFCLVYALVASGLLLSSRSKISKFQFTIYSSVFMLTIAGTTFGYYLTLMLVPFIVLANENLAIELRLKNNLRLWNLYLIFLFASVPPWPINWGNLPLNVGDAWKTLGVHWSLVHLLASLLVILSLVQLSFHSIHALHSLKGKKNE